MHNHSALGYLTEVTRQLLTGCQVPADDGTVLYTPDGRGNYRALWTRDFAYMVEYAGDLIPPEHREGGIRYLLRGQRDDGTIPDRVRPDGVPIYVAGPEDHPLGKPNLDNAPFLVIAADAHGKLLDESQSRRLFREWAEALARGMDTVPRSPHGLVYNDPQAPHSPYGFTDTIAKTGELLMESLLYWRACGILREGFEQMGASDRADTYAHRAALIETHLDRLWDDSLGVFVAATQDCRQPDIWGNAYAIFIEFPLGAKRERVLDFLVRHYDQYVWQGQVRHLLRGTYWQRLLVPVARDRYQNGAYWATASGWVFWSLAQVRPTLARQMAADLIEDFQAHGIYECVNEATRKLDSYVVSATNPLGAARRLPSLFR